MRSGTLRGAWLISLSGSSNVTPDGAGRFQRPHPPQSVRVRVRAGAPDPRRRAVSHRARARWPAAMGRDDDGLDPGTLGRAQVRTGDKTEEPDARIPAVKVYVRSNVCLVKVCQRRD